MKKHKTILRYTLLFAAVFLTSALITIRLTGSAPQKLLRADFRGTVLRNLPYENAGGHRYDLYIPEGTPRQLILYIHSGSFNSGAKEDGAYQPYIDEISPARLVRADSVPTLCGYGLRDHLVPPISRERLLSALTETGVPHDYLPFPNSNHGMYADLDVMQRFIDLSLDYCERYFAAE